MKYAIIILIALATNLAAQCPDTPPLPFISVGAFRQSGQLIGNGAVRPGETILLQPALTGYFYDPVNQSPTAGFGGGVLTVSLAGDSMDVTPKNGIELIGPACGGYAFVRSEVVAYTVTLADLQAGRIIVRVDYTSGISTMGTAVRACTVGLIRVR